MIENPPKVFCIGFQKTGTTSLGAALELLGLRVCGAFGCWRPDIAQVATNLANGISACYDAFQDNPWPMLYGQMDWQWPGSRYIFSHRPEDVWMASMRNYFRDGGSPMEEWLYGSRAIASLPDCVLLDRYRRHTDEVKAYFSGRPNDLLVFDISHHGWEELCGFLGMAVPDKPFPHCNNGSGPGRRPPVPLRTPQPDI
ncbi:sulfotransferase [Rhodospirillum sp. A1_3_36]|uniref:sulfotransferase n=1 Tax=Rhodospirillum sp. A1_3_36 TaxID=3391666 RepID=UPI0039A70D0B